MGDLIELKRASKRRERLAQRIVSEAENYFKIGIDDDYILIRRDFPVGDISPSVFSELITEMFRRNAEARHGK